MVRMARAAGDHLPGDFGRQLCRCRLGGAAAPAASGAGFASAGWAASADGFLAGVSPVASALEAADAGPLTVFKDCPCALCQNRSTKSTGAAASNFFM